MKMQVRVFTVQNVVFVYEALINFDILLNIASIPYKGMTCQCCPKKHSCALILMKCIESFIQYQYVKPHSPWKNNGIFPESD